MAEVDQDGMLRIAKALRVGPDREIPPAFVEALNRHPAAVRSSTADALTFPPVMASASSKRLEGWTVCSSTAEGH
jgi:hypothetical protein